jgi:Predicted metal-dependent RNase, consists of a metallo-beta-lactamase domain and an RNA-binding KH domain
VDNLVVNIFKSLPQSVEVTRVEYEGPAVSIYIKNPKALDQNFSEVVKKLAKDLKKRVIIKADPSVRKSEQETKEIIKSLVPETAEVVDVKFDDVMGEVIIKAKKPGLVIGKGGSLQQRIFFETLWKPVIVREPPIKSKMLDSIMSHIVK